MSDENATPTIDDIEGAISELDSQENAGNTSDVAENDESASETDEKAQAIEALQTEIADLKAENARVLKAVDRMVRMYGAKINGENAKGVEAFPADPMKVEPTFGDDLADVPALDQIKLS